MKRLITLSLLLAAILTGCNSPGVTTSIFNTSGMTEVYRTYTKEAGYTHVYHDGKQYYNQDGAIVIDSNEFDNLEIIPVYFSSKPAAQYSYYRGTSIPDPASLGLSSITLYMPYNYKCSVDGANVYLATCLSLGYELESLKQSSTRAELVLRNEWGSFRVVVYKSILKIYGKNLENQDWR